MCINDKAMQTFLQNLPVPVWHIVKSSGVVITLVFMLKKKNTRACRFPIKLWFRPAR